MNIFYLDKDPQRCAQYHCNSHVIKQILESAQLLSTAHRLLDKMYLTKEQDDVLYGITHRHHPSYKWVQRSKQNYEYLFQLFQELLKEYTYRYRNKHASEKLLEYLKVPPLCIPDKGFTAFTQVVPEECRSTDPVEAYRAYYTQNKLHLLEYKGRDFPDWLLDAFSK